MKTFFTILFTCIISQQCIGQCVNGLIVFRESFGGSFSSVDIGPAISNATTPYQYSNSGIISEGQYAIRKQTAGVNSWAEGNDNTGQGGYMMMVRSKANLGSFYETTIKGFCRAQSQSVCFAAASLNKSGFGRDALIHVEVRNSGNNILLAQFTSSALKNNDSISWGTFSFSYPLPNGVSSVQINFFFSSNTSAPDDFAIDDIRITNIGASVTNGNASTDYPFINGRYEFPVFACLNETVTFTMPGLSFAGKEVQWERLMPDYSYQPIPGANSPVFIIDSAKRADSKFYRLRIADSGYLYSSNCSYPTSPVGLHVDPEPVIETNAPICEGKDLYISVTEGSYVTWTGPNGLTTTGRKIDIPYATVSNGGVYEALVRYNAGCVLNFTVKDSIVVTKNPIHFYIPLDTSICKGNTVTLDVTNPSSLYTWTTGSNAPSINVQNDGLYTVIVYSGDCTKIGNSTIHVIDRPSILLRQDTTICLGDTLLLSPVLIDATKYKWSTGALTPNLLVTQKGKFTLQVSNNCGTNAASVNIGLVRCSEDILVPSAFTPNKDGLNDVFRPAQDANTRQYKMIIYNRWGQQVFNSFEISKGWDGMVNRVEQPTGSYVWVINYTSISGKLYSINGTVTLIR